MNNEQIKILTELFTPEQRKDIVKALVFSSRKYLDAGREDRAEEMCSLAEHVDRVFSIAEQESSPAEEFDEKKFREELTRSLSEAIDNAFKECLKKHEGIDAVLDSIDIHLEVGVRNGNSARTVEREIPVE